MARIRVASILSTAQGKFGSAVLSVKKGGEGTMRELVVPANPKTAPQMNVRGAFGTSARSFKGMPNVDALAWDAYGATQRSKTGKPLSGIAAYNRLAIVYRIVNNGASAPLTPPAADYLGDGFAVTATAQPHAIAFKGSDNTGQGSVVEILLQRLPSRNRKPTLGGYKTVAYTTFTDGNDNTYTAPVGPGVYAAAFRFVNRTTGQQTELVQLNVLGVTLEVVAGGADEKPAAPARKRAA